MDCTGKLMEYYTDLIKEFHHHYLDVLEDYGTETVHDLRVNFKQQMAFFYLLEALTQDFHAEEAIAAYGKLYKKAGKVRDLQVEAGLIAKEESVLDLAHYYSSWLTKRQAGAVEKLQAYEMEYSLLPVRAVEEEVKRKLMRLETSRLGNKLEQYFTRILAGISDVLLDRNPAEEQLHFLRKRIKELYYNIRLLNTVFPETRLQKKDLKPLSNVQKLLGDWHDFDFTIRKIDKDELICPKQLYRKLLAEREAYLTKLSPALQKTRSVLPLLEQQLQTSVKLINCSTFSEEERENTASESVPQQNMGERFA